MITELKPHQFDRIASLFDHIPTEQSIAIQSVIAGNTKGRIFVDNTSQPKTALVWVIYCMFYFLGDPENPDFNDALPGFFQNELIPMNEALDCSCFIMTLLEDRGWKKMLDGLFRHFSYETGFRSAFYFDVASFQAQNGFAGMLTNVLPIDNTLEQSPESAELMENILEFWPNLRAFLDHGIGYIYKSEDGHIASACFSVASAKGFQEIVINTYDQSDRKKGYGSLVARAFIKKCLQRRLTPVWNAYETNLPSVKIAEKMGFKLQAKLPYYEFPFADFRIV